MIRLSAFYAFEEGARFDLEYYRHSHLPMVLTLMNPYGAVRYEVDRGLFSRGGATPEFIAIGHIFLENLEGWNKGLAVHGTKIMDDVKNYTNLIPRVQYSEML